MSDEIDRLYEAECAFVDRVKRGDKEAIDSTSLIEHLRAENERLTAENQKITSLQKLCPCGGLESGNHFSDCPYLLALKSPDLLHAADRNGKAAAEIDRLRAEVERLRAKVAKEIREAAKGSVYAKGRSHAFICGLQDGYEAAAQIACNDHRIIDKDEGWLDTTS